LDGQKYAEKLKMEINKKMFEVSKEKKHPQHILEAIAVQEKAKCSDRFYNEMGYEIQDMSESFERLGL
jgi:hypothetical protein